MMEEWKEYRIKEIGKVITGNTPPRANPKFYGSHTLFVKPTDIDKNTKYTYKPEECYSKLAFDKYKKSLIPKGATCVVTIGSIGEKMTKAHCNLFINQAMNAVIPFDNFDEDFVFYLLKQNLQQIRLLDSGTASGRENVSKSSFSNIKVKAPESKETQRRIAKILSAYDDLIENNLKRIKLLEEMAQKTYEEWFVRMKFPGHENAVFDRETGLPEGWKKGAISEVIGFVSGFAFKSKDFQEKGNSVIKIRNIGNNTIDIFKTDCVSNSINVPEKFRLKGGDLLIAMTGATIGKVGFVPKNNKIIFLNQRVGKFQIKGEVNNIAFISCIFNSEIGIQQILNFASGAAQPNISGSEILSIKSVIPSNIILKNFSDEMSPVINEILNFHYQNQRLKEARDILLPRLMIGVIDVEEMEIKL